MNTLKISLVSISIILVSVLMLTYKNSSDLKSNSIFEYPTADDLDYHFLAVNFALKNQFPVIGFLADPNEYKMQYQPSIQVGQDSTYLDAIKAAGPVHTFVRPPLYSLMVGLMYKIFGVHLSVLIWFNILLVALTASMLPYMGYKIWAHMGLIIGLIAAFLFIWFGEFYLSLIDVEILSNFLFLSLFFIALLIQKYDTFIRRFILGVLIALEFLCKPVIIFFIPLYILYYFFYIKELSFRQYLKNVSAIFVGMAIVFSPWAAYINREVKVSENERSVWAAKIEASMTPPLMYGSKEEIVNSETNTINAVRNFTKYMLIRYTETGGTPILVTNQSLQGEAFMILNNEYCIDNILEMGNIGWLWKYIRTSYYNTRHLEESNFMKVLYFYKDNPSYLYLIPFERLKYSGSTNYPLIFWLTPALWGLAVICKRLLCKKITTTRNALLLLAFVTLLLSLLIAFYVDVIVPLKWSVGFLGLISLSGLILWKREHDLSVSGIFYVSWLSIFLFILLLYGDQRFTKTIFAVNCFIMVFFVYNIIRMLFIEISNHVRQIQKNISIKS